MAATSARNAGPSSERGSWRRNCDAQDDTVRRDYLDSEERQAAYIAAALETGDADFVRDALGIVARARGMAGVAKSAGLSRESLYKALGESGNPEFATVMRVVRAMGLRLSARSAAPTRSRKKRRVKPCGTTFPRVSPTGLCW